jgi:hypothetical protein
MNRFREQLGLAARALLELSAEWEHLSESDRAKVEALDWTLVFNMSVDEIPYTLARFANELKANTSWVQI